MEEIIQQNSGEVKSILLHSCCAPCSSHVIDTLTKYFDITILYYNPNIEPYEEYLKRKNEQIRFIKEYQHKEINFLDCDYDNESFRNKVKGLEHEKEGGARCPVCYRIRLEYTAIKAKEMGYDYFGTTLTVSPYKHSKTINEIGESLEKKYKIKFLYSDFKKKDGYKKSIEMSREYNLYRQDYCGCLIGKNNE
jgi:predicted adenine nucleotide alpha hydrolase (AANH) superfamily ATPase